MRLFLLLIIILIGQELIYSQTQPTLLPQNMTRPKLWIRANPNGSLEREQSMQYDWEMLYPGYWDSRSYANGSWDNNGIYNGAQVAGEDVAWMYRNGPYDDGDIYAIAQTTLTKNYNLIANPNAPEEYIAGQIGSYKYDSKGKRHMSYTLDGKIYGWSQPGYSDFVIIKCKLTNTDDTTFNNFYYARYFTMLGPYAPSSVSPGWDKEYLWDSTVSKEIGFIFYDATSIPPTGSAPSYSIPPGDSTGNAGDPGNIGTQGSRDYKLYAPWLYANSFIPSTITINKNGERKVWRSIISSSSQAPPEERMPSPINEMPIYANMVNFITSNQQPEISWSTANQNYQSGNLAGSLYERNPRYVYAIGPYDIKPGQSIEWTEILLCGGMDRDTTILGGYTATKNFLQSGLINIKANWERAKQLIASNYRFPTGKIPPPTPANAPKVGNTAELIVTASSSIINGLRTPGVNITFPQVHQGYIDPQSRKADFKAYNIYRSDISAEGPWNLIRTIQGSEADTMISGTDISLFVPATSGIPYRYCVTAIDTDGNESAKTGYNLIPVASEPNPSDNQSNIVVVPNPFRQVSGFADQNENKRLGFYNIPSKCTIRIYTIALDLIRTIEHDGAGMQSWGTQASKDYMLTDFGQNVMPGVYIYHVTSHVSGHEGETSVGKFVIIK